MVKRGIFSRLVIGLVLLTVMFTQLGVNLLHAHQGAPMGLVVVHNSPDSGNTCQACALDAVPCALFVESPEVLLVAFSNSLFQESLVEATLLPAPTLAIGRAPPVC